MKIGSEPVQILNSIEPPWKLNMPATLAGKVEYLLLEPNPLKTHLCLAQQARSIAIKMVACA